MLRFEVVEPFKNAGLYFSLPSLSPFPNAAAVLASTLKGRKMTGS